MFVTLGQKALFGVTETVREMLIEQLLADVDDDDDTEDKQLLNIFIRKYRTGLKDLVRCDSVYFIVCDVVECYCIVCVIFVCYAEYCVL